MSESLKLEAAGRPRHPKWDEMNDIDKYLKLCFMIAQNLTTGKWKFPPRTLYATMEHLREGLVNKYPDYFKTLGTRELMAEQPQPAQQTLPAPNVPPVEKQPEEIPLWKHNVDTGV